MGSERMPLSSVRGRIRDYIERHADKLGDDVLEVGSRMTRPDCWWIVNRDLAKGQWLGIDMQPGHGVDLVADIHDLPAEWCGRFSGVLCSEVLEHVARPWVALPKLREVIRPGGWVVGIKGLPGRGGIGMGHRDNFRGTDDPCGALLREWIGEDAEAYL